MENVPRRLIGERTEMAEPAERQSEAADERPEQRPNLAFHIEMQAEPDDGVDRHADEDESNRIHGQRPLNIAARHMVDDVAGKEDRRRNHQRDEWSVTHALLPNQGRRRRWCGRRDSNVHTLRYWKGLCFRKPPRPWCSALCSGCARGCGHCTLSWRRHRKSRATSLVHKEV